MYRFNRVKWHRSLAAVFTLALLGLAGARPAYAEVNLGFGGKFNLGFMADPALRFSGHLDLNFYIWHSPLIKEGGSNKRIAVVNVPGAFVFSEEASAHFAITQLSFHVDGTKDVDTRIYGMLKELFFIHSFFFFQVGVGYVHGTESKASWIDLPIHLYTVGSYVKLGVDFHVKVHGEGQDFASLVVGINFPVLRFFFTAPDIPAIIAALNFGVDYVADVPIDGGTTVHRVLFGLSFGSPLGLH